MATMNPFYRFEDAPLVGSMGQRSKDLSFATYLIYQDLFTSYNGYSLAYAAGVFQSVVNQYNIDYQANFIVQGMSFPPPAAYPYNAQIFIYDTNIVAQFPILRISFTCEINSAGIIVNNKLSFLGYLNENYSYSPALYNGEREAYAALESLQNTGAAIFPKWYKYNSLTGIAKSSMARFKDCEYDTGLGMAVRVTPDTNPRGGVPMIKLNPLDGNAKYIVSLFDNLIQKSQQTGETINSLLSYSEGWVVPNGYTFDYFDDFGPYNRFQVNIYKTAGGEGLTLIAREENGFMFQRFYSPNYTSYNLLNDYLAGTDLPYETTANDKKYANIFYDYEFCDFQECAYPIKESYLMPIKSGDEIRFNIDAYASNIFAENTVDIGLFDDNYNLVQKIGVAELASGIGCCGEPCELDFEIIITYENGNVDELIDNFNYFRTLTNPAIYFQLSENQVNDFIANNLLAGFNAINPAIVYDINSVVAFFDANPIIDCEIIDEGIRISISYANIPEENKEYLECPKYYKLLFWFVSGMSVPFLYRILGGEGAPIQCVNQVLGSQYYGTAIIPNSKSGCYRLGLYRFESGYNGLETTWELLNTLVAGTNYVFALCPPANPFIGEYIWAVPNSINTMLELYQWASDNIPFVETVLYQSILNPQEDSFGIRFCPYIGLNNWVIRFGVYDYTTGIVSEIPQAETSAFQCGEEPINEIYAFSNLLYLDNSDCFSSIVQYWAESNSIAEGNEYYGEWYQQVRLGINGGGQKPVISENIYRQSNGVHRRPSNKQDLSIDLHTDFLDLETQSALVDATRHPNFVVNGQNLFVTGDIEVATIQDFSTQSSFEDLAQVKFSALIQGYQPKNSTCVNC